MMKWTKNSLFKASTIATVIAPTVLTAIFTTQAAFAQTPATAGNSKPVATATAGKLAPKVPAVSLPLEVQVSNRGLPYDKHLKLKSSNVPTLEIYQRKVVKGKTELFRLKNIPAINLGLEPTLTLSTSALHLAPQEPVAFDKVERLPSPQLSPGLLENVPNPVALTGPKILQKNTDLADFKNPVPDAQAEVVDVKNPPALKPVAVQSLSPKEISYYQALFMMPKKSSKPFAFALLAELADDQSIKEDDPLKERSRYYLARIADELGVNSIFATQMISLAQSKNPEMRTQALKELRAHFRPENESLVETIEKLSKGMDFQDITEDQYKITRSKYLLKINQFAAALESIDSVAPVSPRYGDAQLLKAIIDYRVGNLIEAVETLQNLIHTLGDTKVIVVTKSTQNELLSLASMTLGRIEFQQGHYQQAYDAYLKVGKDSSGWSQAMVEQAWAQILANDYEGAAGNMFSMHVSHFRKLFNPDSYVARVVSYLNLCQFGDGVKVLAEFKGRYGGFLPIMEKVSAGLDHQELGYYQTLKQIIQNQNAPNPQPLPKEFFAALGNNADFIGPQKQINLVEDEVENLNRLTLTLIKSERELLKVHNQLRDKMDKQASTKSVATQDKSGKVTKQPLTDFESELMANQLKLQIAKRARTSLKNIRKVTLTQLDERKLALKKQANVALKNQFKSMSTALRGSLDQADVLSYELYSGAGEHLRYQMAGGNLGGPEDVALQRQDQKSLQWNFKGEIWDDEIGHYRSGLKNVCPTEQISQRETE